MKFPLLLILCLPLAVWAQSGKEDTSYPQLKVRFQSWDEEPQHYLNLFRDAFGVADSLRITDIDQDDIGVTLMEGVTWTKYFGAEGAAHWYGETDVTAVAETLDAEGQVVNTTTYVMNAQQYGIDLTFVGRYPVRDWLYAYGKAGIGYWRLESDVVRDGTTKLDARRNRNDAAAVFGAGIRATFNNESFLVDLNWEMTEIDEQDLSSVSLGAGFTF